MKKSIVFLYRMILIALLVSAGGCTSMTMMRTKELRAVQSHVDSLKAELVALQKTMHEEQKSQGEILRLMRADQQLRFDELSRMVGEISTNLNENQFRLSKIDEKTVAFQKKFEAKLISDSMDATARNKEAENLFQMCMNDFSAGRFDIAIKGFADVAAQFPQSDLASEAEYWVAECYYARRSYEQAEKEYLSYIKKYPKGSKFCVTLYKLGLAYAKQGKVTSRNMVWKKAIEQCPDSPEVSIIKSELR